MPLPPSRQYFGIGTKPVEEYFQPVVPEMGRRLSTGNKADIFMADRAINQLAEQYAMQDEALRQRQYADDMARRERAFGQRMQSELGPEIEDDAIAQYRQKLASTQDRQRSMDQKNRFLDSAAGINFQSEEGLAQVEKLAAQNPHAMSDPDVQHYLRIRGYQPQDTITRERAVRDYMEGLAPNEQKFATGKTLPAIKSQVEFNRRQQQTAMQLAQMGIAADEIEALKDEAGAFDPVKVGEAMHEAKIKSYDRPMTDKMKRDEVGRLVRSLASIVAKDELSMEPEQAAQNENIKRYLLRQIKELGGEDLAASPDAGKPSEPMNFNSQADAEAAVAKGKIKSGDKVIIGGKTYTWKD